MNINQKVNMFLTHLKSTGRVKNQEEFGRELGYTNKYSFSRLLSGNDYSDLFMERLIAKYPEFEKFNTPSRDAIAKSFSNLKSVKLISKDDYAGFLDSFFSKDFKPKNKNILHEMNTENDANLLAFEVISNEMSPDYNIGDVLICEEIDRNEWRNNLPINDYDFVLLHGEKGIVITEVTAQNNETNQITCATINGEKDSVYKLSELAFIYAIKEVRQSGKNKRQKRKESKM